MHRSRHTLSQGQDTAPTFGVIFAGKTVSDAHPARHLHLDARSFISWTIRLQTREEASTIDVSDLDCVFVVADLKSDGDLVNAVEDRIRSQSTFRACVALESTAESAPIGGSDTFSGISMPIVTLAPPIGDVGGDDPADAIGMAIHAVECIARSVLDGRIVGVCLSDLFHYVFQEGHVCTCRFEVCSFPIDGGASNSSSFDPSSFTGLQLSQASAALVAIETPEMPEMQVRRMARDAINAVRRQMLNRADCLYAATVNNTLVGRYLVSVLAMERKAQ